MSKLIARVSLNDLEAFLSEHAESWDFELNGLQGFEEYLRYDRSVSVGDLIHAFTLAIHDEDHVFVFGSEMPPEEAVEAVGVADLPTLPMVDRDELTQFIISFGNARDFLYVAPSIENASNAFYVNLMPVEEDEDPEEEDESDTDIAPARFRLNSITVGNFKGIDHNQIRIDFKPITLLFGPNSSGKSSILHAILYAREILERRNLDARTTQVGGNLLDLGGFEQMVHNRIRSNWITLCFEFQIGDRLIPSHAPSGTISSPVSNAILPELGNEVDSAAIKIAVAWSDLREMCYGAVPK